jgi:class 3 adenylate cyclase/TolB-like protein
MSVERRRAAILSADAKGFSRLMGEDEVGTVRTLIAYRTVMREVITHHHGRVVDSPGDNLLAEFAGVVDAVQSALEIQQSLRERNAELSEGRRLEFRIGVNVGDVMTDEDRIYGDAVNIAARLEGMAEAGGICVSQDVYDAAAAVGPTLKWESLGEQALKNISRRVGVYRARLAPAPWGPASEPPFRPVYRPSIAVLRFREFDVGEEHRYFAEGIVEDISGALASLPDLFVISSNSTSRFQSGPLNIATVGHDLAVRYVLSGSVRRAGKRIRILSELADTETQMVLWTDRIEGQVDDIFELQDRLSEKIVTTIAPHVRAAEIRRALRKRPENLDAYDFMLRGLDLLYKTRSGAQTARSSMPRSRKVVVPASGKSVPGDDGLGEGEDRLEPVKDLPSPCPACNGSGRQRIGCGDRSEPRERCCGAGREKNILRNPNYFCLYPDHRVSLRLDGRCLIRSRIRADHGSSLVFCPHRSFDAREAESVRGVAVHSRDGECVRRVIDQENSLQARDEFVKDLHPLRPELESSRSAIPVMWQSPSDQTGRRRTADERTADAVVGARVLKRVRAAGFWRVPRHYPGDGLGPSPGTGGSIPPRGILLSWATNHQNFRSPRTRRSAPCRPPRAIGPHRNAAESGDN